MQERVLPDGATLGPTFIRTEPQCETCTHYFSEHLEDGNHCAHIMYYLKLPKELEPYKNYDRVVRPRQHCSCKKFAGKK